MRDPKPFEFELSADEAAHITGTTVTGSGGRQSFQRMLAGQVATHPNKVILTDVQMGKLCRYIGQYETGGAQDRLRKAFGRNLKELLGI